MRVGIDFDNTIVSYDALFHKVAQEQGVIPVDCLPTKLAVRNHLRIAGKEDIWTEMQGLVYGPRMEEASAFPGVFEFLRWARDSGIDVAIISHRTQHPFLGPRYDLHASARRWVASQLIDVDRPLIESEAVFFELTREQKIQRIAAWQCDYFIDDLPEVLWAPSFPSTTVKLLFDPDRTHKATDAGMEDWAGIRRYFELRCSTRH
jgi:hypothetical protein